MSSASLRTYRLQQMLDQMNRLVQNIDEDTAKLKIPISNPKITPNILNNTSPSQPLSTSSSSSSSSTSTHKEIKAEQNIAGTIDNTEAAQLEICSNVRQTQAERLHAYINSTDQEHGLRSKDPQLWRRLIQIQAELYEQEQ